MAIEISRVCDLTQIALPFGSSDDVSFESFVGASNARAAQLLQEQVHSPQDAFVYLSGPAGSGKTHLAIAALKLYEARGVAAAYLSLPSLVLMSSAELTAAYDAFKDYDVVVIEDVQDALPSPAIETFLFNLFNCLNVSMRQMIVTASCAVSQLAIGLPDLASRYNSGLSLRLVSMDDGEKEQIFRDVAHARGLEVGSDVSSYIIRRSGRHLGALLDTLNKLDQASWEKKQKLSIPFVKKTLDW